MVTPPEVLEGAANWARLTRWERAELGRRLRREGWTYSEIMAVLPVVKGTLAGWCHEIRLSEEQVDAIRARRPPGIRTGIPVDTQRKRRAEIEKIKKAAALDAVHLLSDPLWMAGVVLYWAEGSKTKRGLELTNTDERALRLFMRWTTSYLIPDASFVLALHLHEGNDDEEARQHWASRLGLDDPDFHRTFIKPVGTGHRKNKHTYGVCRVRVRRSSDAFQKTMAWIETVADLFSPPPPLKSNWVAGAIGSATDS